MSDLTPELEIQRQKYSSDTEGEREITVRLPKGAIMDDVLDGGTMRVAQTCTGLLRWQDSAPDGFLTLLAQRQEQEERVEAEIHAAELSNMEMGLTTMVHLRDRSRRLLSSPELHSLSIANQWKKCSKILSQKEIKMIVDYNPNDYKVVSFQHTCDFHKRNPGKSWAGCTCAGSHGWVKKPAEELLAAQKESDHDDHGREQGVHLWHTEECPKHERAAATCTCRLLERLEEKEFREKLEVFTEPKCEVLERLGHEDDSIKGGRGFSDIKLPADAMVEIKRLRKELVAITWGRDQVAGDWKNLAKEYEELEDKLRAITDAEPVRWEFRVMWDGPFPLQWTSCGEVTARQLEAKEDFDVRGLIVAPKMNTEEERHNE